MNPEIKLQAAGRWRQILPAFGVDPRLLDGRHHPCPVCGGRDRFRFDNREGKGTFFCSQCGSGDGVKLVMLTQGVGFVDAAALIRKNIGNEHRQQEEPLTTERSAEDKDAAWRGLWLGGAKITQDTAAWKYLGNRIGSPPDLHCLRYCPSLAYKSEAVSRHPAMIALVVGADGKAVNVHRTYITHDGRKADLPSPRRMMPGEVPAGSAVRLFPSAPVMGVAEGIETAIAASLLYRMPVWAAIDARGLAAFAPPDTVQKLVVFGDHDESFTGQAAAYECARRNSAQGRPCMVMIPDTIGHDWNDVLLDEIKEKQGLAA